MSKISILKKGVCDTAKRSYNEALVAGTSGNVSAFDYESKLMAITPSGLDYSIMCEDDIMVIDFNGSIVEGTHKPSSEWRMHAEIYKQRNDILAVLHTHSPYATSFAVLKKRVPLILIEMLPFLGGDIPVAEFCLPGSEELGREALKVLDKRNACLLSNHGTLAVGTTLEQAHLRAVYVEDASKIYHYACSVGIPNCVPEEAAEIMRRKFNLKK